MKHWLSVVLLMVVGAVLVACGEDSGNSDPLSGGGEPVPGAMVAVQGGTFEMVDPDDAEGGVTVTVSDYTIGQYEVTQKEWADIMGANPADQNGTGDNYPVYNISWFEVLVYCNKRSISEGLSPCYTISGSTDPSTWGAVPVYDTDITFSAWNAVTCDLSADGYRLPTEVEWEYAARGGVNHADNYDYSGSDDLNAVAWFEANSGGSTHLIGTKASNQIGVNDMSGNLYEFCWDWYAPYTDNVTDPTGPASGDMRIVRGGSWMSIAENCVVDGRYREYPNSTYSYNGFRVVRRP